LDSSNCRSEHEINPMLLAWRGEELGTPPHWEGASIVPDAPPSSRTLLRSIGGHPRGEAEDVVGSICEYEIARKPG